MNPVGRLANVSDRALDRGLRLGVLALVVGALAFGGIYYRDRHVSAGPSLLDRQVSAAEAAVRAAPGSVPARLALAQAYQADKRLDSAVKQYQQILSVNGNHRAALLGLGKAYLAKKNLDKAKETFQRVVSVAKPGEFAGSDPQLEEAYYFLGSIAIDQGQAKSALTQLDAALKINPTDSDAWYLVGVARLKTGDAKQAVPALQRALAFVPTGWCEPYGQLTKAYTTLGQAPKAEYAGAMSDVCHQRYAKAKQRLTALTNGPETVNAMLGLGLIAESSSQPDEAVAWYRKVLGKDKTNPTALAALSRLGVTPPASGSTSHSSSATSSRQGA